MAGHTITFVGRLTDKEKHEVLSNSLGFMFPVENEDFGISAIEAMSHGIPVLAHRSGGPLEFIEDGINGMFFNKLKLEEFIHTLKDFDDKCKRGLFNSSEIKKRVQRFDKERFKQEIKEFVERNT